MDFTIIDTTFLINAQESGQFDLSVDALNKPGRTVYITQTVYAELSDGSAAKVAFDNYMNSQQNSATKIEKLAPMDYNGRTLESGSKNSGDKSIADLYRYLQEKGFDSSQINVLSDDEFTGTEGSSPDGKTGSQKKIMLDINGKEIPATKFAEAMGQAQADGNITPEEYRAVRDGSVANGRDGVMNQPWEGHEGWTRDNGNSTYKKTFLPEGMTPEGEGWVSDTKGKNLSPDVARLREQTETNYREAVRQVQADPSSYTPEGRYTPDAQARINGAKALLGALGLALALYDAWTTSERMGEAQRNGNYDLARDELAGLSGRLLGGLWGGRSLGLRWARPLALSSRC